MAVLIGNGDSGAVARAKINGLFFTTVNPQINDYTLVLADAFTNIEMNKATALNLTVPQNSSVAFDVGTAIRVKRTGAGLLTFVQDTNVTITASSGLLTDSGLNVTMTLRKTGTNTWDLQNGAPGSWASWTPTITGFSSPPTFIARYFLIGKMCTVYFTSTAAGTSDSINFTITLPFIAANIQHNMIPFWQNNSGTGGSGRVSTASGSNIASLFTTTTGTAWTAANNKSASFWFTYEIQ